MKTLEKIVSDSVYLPSYELSRRLAGLYPNDFILETEDRDFNLREFVKGKRCEVRLRDDLHCQADTIWHFEDGGDIEPRNAFFEVRWRGVRLKVLRVSLFDGDSENERHWIIAPRAADVKAFFSAVCRWNTQVRGEILVFAQACWYKDEKLFEEIKSASLDDLVLPPEVKEPLAHDVTEFFLAEETYKQYDIAWKRGILLLGPPGNGKTHMIKALVSLAGKPCLYVRSLKSTRYTAHDCINMVFTRARKTSPCVLVFEDLDSMIDNSNRSFFLNELDGFASNHGILILATTNYPEKLDPAILERPSRFDRKVTFELPALRERSGFLAVRNETLAPETRLSEAGISEVANATEGFSFAYLKELWVSSMVAWMRERKPDSMDGIMSAQVVSLRQQMKTEPAPIKEPIPDED